MMYRVTARGLNLRLGPDLKAGIVRELPRGTALVSPSPPLASNGWMVAHTFHGEAGWVASRYVVEDPAPWLSVARQEMETGVHEIPGTKHAARILEYHGTTTLKATADEVAWCSAFVNWCMLAAGIVGTRLATARSWLKWGHVIPHPVPGCITVLTRGTDLASGHVGFYVRTSGTRIYLLGGNQSNAITEAPFAQTRVLGYRWPVGAPMPDFARTPAA